MCDFAIQNRRQQPKGDNTERVQQNREGITLTYQRQGEREDHSGIPLGDRNRDLVRPPKVVQANHSYVIVVQAKEGLVGWFVKGDRGVFI